MKRSALVITVILLAALSGCGFGSDKLSGPTARQLATKLSCESVVTDTTTSASKVACQFHDVQLGISTYPTRGTFKDFLNAFPGQVLVGNNFIIEGPNAKVLESVQKIVGGQLTKD